ncbi:hypothetical protein FHW69_003515 [Luteibacter sp. Sphag1AF]|uniref:hypothetical protein n=1 Tax=Luteibacter sp. Sphag1AF TaxID=2587031 RepID=UPI001616371A|nr:hypothetical protein [Luteibacter sp. Sphag1AF]MBB3228870.1 hypothetical protein [Luteibacter sp. Sphag1AF]
MCPGTGPGVAFGLKKRIKTSIEGASAVLYDIFHKAAGAKKRRGRFDVFRVSRPDTRLDAAAQRAVLEGFARETDALYQADTSFHWLGKPDYFKTLNDLWAVFLDRELVGFTGIRIVEGVGERIVYIDNMNIRSIPLMAVGRHTIGSMLVHEMLCAHFPYSGKPMSVVFRTQNPSVYRLAYSILPHSVYPRIDRRKARDEDRSRRVAAFMAGVLSPGKTWESDVSVIRSAYPGHIYGRPFTSAQSIKPVLARFWKDNIRLEAGDALLICGCLTHREVRLSVAMYLKALFAAHVRSRIHALTRFTRRGTPVAADS